MQTCVKYTSTKQVFSSWLSLWRTGGQGHYGPVGGPFANHPTVFLIRFVSESGGQYWLGTQHMDFYLFRFGGQGGRVIMGLLGGPLQITQQKLKKGKHAMKLYKHL